MADERVRQQAFGLPIGGRDRFCVLREPAAGTPRGVVVHVPALAEEMNKSRRMTAWCSRELAARGFCVLQIDLLGCGDSAGDFAEASWGVWQEDILAAVDWMRGRAAGAPLWLWGLRAGALLACSVLGSLPRDTSLLLWQPVASGSQHLTQFLRLAVAADALALDADRARTKGMREALAQGTTLEIAGYSLAPALANGLDGAKLALPDGHEGTIVWLEVAAEAGAAPTPVAAAWTREYGERMNVHVVAGPRFWQSVEIEDCPAIVDASVAALASLAGDVAVDRAGAAV